MKVLWALFCGLLPLAAAAQEHFPLGAANRDGTTTVSVISRQCVYPLYNDKVFYADPAGNAPSFLFPDYGQANTPIGGCGIGRKYMYWVVEYKVDGLSNVRTFTVNPNPGDATKTVIVISHNTRRTQCIGGGETHDYQNLKSFTIKFETPEFSGLEEMKTVCNSVDKDYNLIDNFSVKEGVTFYLDNTASAPITRINPKDLAPGFHKLIAQKLYDNGTPDPTYGSRPGIVTTTWEFQVLEGVQITVGAYPASICQNGPGINVKAAPDGGSWEGRGIDAAGNVTPESAATGRNLFTYKITNAAGCTSTKTIEINVNAPPEVTVNNIDVCRSAAPFTLTIGQPAGGTYTGRGVVGATFDPALALVGSNLIRYSYTDPATGCSSTAEFNINVLDADNFRVGEDLTTCLSSPEINLNTRDNVSPSDGAIVWSGPGIVNTKYFSPATAGLGLHTIKGTLFIPETGCTYEKTFVAKVVSSPAVTAGDDLTVCGNAAAFNIPGGSPVGGTWSGMHVNSNSFNPSVALPGDYLLTYTYTTAVCAVEVTKLITVKPVPIIDFGPDYAVCRNAGLQTLPAASPTGGRWTADGPYLDAPAGTIDPLKMTVGDNTLIYTYSDGTCTVSKQLKIKIDMPPVAEAGQDLRTCVNAEPTTLPTGAGGVWSGPGVDGGRFLPARAGVGEHLLTYTVTDPVTRCNASDQLYMRVSAPPVATAGPDVVICKAGGNYYIPDGEPLGGVWGGPFVASGYFQIPDAPLGSYTLTYTYTDPTTGCTGTDTKVIQLVAAPVIDVGPDYAVCRNAGLQTLPAASPIGGRWTADGPYLDAAAGMIDPLKMAVGANTLTYIYADGTCTLSKQLNITLIMPPLVDAGQDLRTCVNAEPTTLPTGPGGAWSGPGVDGGRFLPARAGVGEHQLTYTVTDPVTRCSASDQLYMRVSAPPVATAGPDVVICKVGGDFYIPDGAPLGGVWSGPFVKDGYFQTMSAPLGSYTVTFTYSDPATGCTGTDTKVIRVAAAPILEVGADISTCAGAEKFAPPVASVPGGTWMAFAGDFYDATNNQVDPEKMQLGKNYLIYTIATAAGCSISDTLGITMHPRPTVTGMRDFSACPNGAAVPLVANPSPGIWEGPGVDNNAGSFFVPADGGIGQHRITYTYTDPTTGCSNTTTTIVKVPALPAMSMPDDTTVCIASGAFALKGLPAGGIWSGSVGLAGTTFNPMLAGVGVHQLTYTVTDPGTRCNNSGSVNYAVKGLPGAISLSGDTAACEGTTVTLTAQADNVNSFDWFRNGDAAPFATGSTIRYLVIKDEQLQVRPKPTQLGDCGGLPRIFSILNNSPRGTVRYDGPDTLAYGALYRATATLEKAAAYRWDFGDGQFSTQADGNHYYYQPGRHDVSLRATGATGCVMTYPLPRIFVRDENGKVPDPDFGRGEGRDNGGNGLLIYPTRARQLVTVDFIANAQHEVMISIVNFAGVLIEESKHTALKGSNRIRLNIGKLGGAGVWYFVRVKGAEFDVTEKIFKL